MGDNTELNLDTSSIRQREGTTTSSLTDRNQLPVFSDAFKDVVEQREGNALAQEESINKQIFMDDIQNIENVDVRSRMFMDTQSEIVIRNDVTHNSVQSFVEIISAVVMAGIMMAVMIAYYGKKRKGEKHAYNHNKKRQ